MDDILNKANIPQYLWAYCSIENDVIKTPDTEVLYQNGLATEQEYLEWQSKQIDICPTKTTEEQIAELYEKLNESKMANETLAQYVSDLEINLIIGGVV